MIATKLSSISLANHCISRQCCPVFASNRLEYRRSGPFLASKGLDSGFSEIDQPLQVVAGDHHRHRKARPRLTDGAQQFATHLLDGAEHVLDPRTRLGNTLVATLLALGQRLVTLALPLDLVAKALLLQPDFTFPGRVAPVSIDVPTRVACIEDIVKMLAVVRAGRVGLDLADDLVLLVDIDRQLVAEVALATLLRPGGVDVLLAPFLLAMMFVGEQVGLDGATGVHHGKLKKRSKNNRILPKVSVQRFFEAPY